MKTLRKYEHINATTLEEAVSLLDRYGEKAWLNAGGTDLIGTLRFEVLRDYPEVIINLKTIPGLDYIREEKGLLKIGALTRLEDIAHNPLVRSRFAALAEAARRTASPHVRAMGTIGGNLCQLIRCWYFRKEDNRFDCLRKGGAMCHAAVGDNRYHSIFGSVRVASPPCSSNCPAGNDVSTYLSYLREGNLSQAARVLLSTNPLPAITGRVCPHKCEKDCNRKELGEALALRSLERWLGDYILEHTGQFFKPPRRENNKEVAIVGSGPAGLAAAYYLRQMGYPVTIFEAKAEAGGVLTYGIPPYRLPKDVVKKQIQAIQNMRVQIKLNTTLGKELSIEALQRDYVAVFIATGAWKQTSLKIPDEELLTSGLEFLSQVNQRLRKLSAQKVLVIGGGSVAMDVATSARRLGVKEVTLACLESREEMPALAEEIEQAIQEGVQLKPSWGPSRVLKEKDELRGIELVRCTSVYDKDHRFSPIYDKSVTEKVEADQIILAIGQRPDLAYAEGVLEIQRGIIVVNPRSQATNLEKVFAGGDATIPGPLSVIAAVATGRRAASSINHYLGGEDIPEEEIPKEHLSRYNGEDFESLSRIEIPHLALSQLGLDKEDISGLDLNEVATEAKRCINCGCDGVNPSDLAPALVALEAKIVTSQRTLVAEEFWKDSQGLKPTVLKGDEIITEIQIPQPKVGVKSDFIKFAIRKSIDFPIVNCAAAIEIEDGRVKSARICLNAVYSHPYRVRKAEEYIQGKAIDEAIAEEAGMAGVSDAIALPYNKFKIQIAKTLIKRTILACK
jgi:NADPH-dependent glutamate synthase beta subunit-like oxidoreductase/CO/xanthine dehydrogenase FAD-binding subunit